MKLIKLTAMAAFLTFFSGFMSACSKSPNSPLAMDQLSSTERAAAAYVGEPFAFDAAVDTISYNSCFGYGLGNQGIYGFKAGAVEDLGSEADVKSGVKITRKYLDFVGKKLQPEYGQTAISTAQIKSFITSSPLNADAVPLIGVRTTRNLSIQPEDFVSTSYISYTDYYPMLGVLTSKEFINSLLEGITFGPTNNVIAEGHRSLDFQAGGEYARSLNASLGYNLDWKGNESDPTESYTNYLRDQMNRRNLALTLTFHHQNSDSWAIDPIGPDKDNLQKAYGKAFYMTFGPFSSTSSGTVMPTSMIPANMVSRVEERDLSTGQLVAGASWRCHNLMIVRPSDNQNTQHAKRPCRPIEPSELSLTSSNYLDENGLPMPLIDMIREARRHYSATQWDVGVLSKDNTIMCIVPKEVGATCYASNLQAGIDRGVDYTPWTYTDDATDGDGAIGCFQKSYSAQGIVYGDPMPRKLCAQWASICARSSVNF